MEGFLRLKQLHRVTGAARTRSALNVGAPGVGGTVSGGVIPLAFNDARFAANTAGSTANVSATTTYANKTWDDSPLYNTPPDWDSEAPFNWTGSGTTFNLSLSRMKWREGFRASCDAGAVLNMSECYIECVGRDMQAFGATRPDHTDCFQVYSPGGSGIVNISKTCFRTYTDQEALALYGGNFIGGAGLLWADDFQGQLNLTDVVFWGGRTGIELYADVGITTIRFNNVYFVPSAQPWAGGDDIIMGVPGTTASLVIAEWNNVREATIVNGVLIPGALIAEPTGTRITNTGGGSSADPGAFNAQTDTFTVEWDTVPNASLIDVVTGVSSDVPTAFSSFACSLRFNSTGAIDSRNAGTYAAVNARTYTSGVSYHCRMLINVAAKTYSSWVTPAGGSEVQIANNYAFRTEQSSVTSLNYLGKLTTTGDVVMTNMTGPPPEALPPVVTDVAFDLSTTGASWIAGKVVGTVSASRSPTSWSITAGNGSGYFAISSAGILTVTSAGIAGLANTSGVSSLSVRATNASGNGTGAVTINRSTAAATVGLYPKSMTDPMFTGMTELNDTLECVAGTTYTKRSWLEHNTGSWSALMASNVTFNTVRMKTREGPRFRGYSNIVFDKFMLEVYGVGADHADGNQWEGGANNNVVYRHCHIRVTPGAYTGFFVADSATGQVTFEDCLFSCAAGGGTGIIIYADAGFGTVKLSMKDCMIQQNGWGTSSGPMLINKTVGGTNAADVILWDNVRFCNWDHATGTLTPLGLMPQPANT